MFLSLITHHLSLSEMATEEIIEARGEAAAAGGREARDRRVASAAALAASDLVKTYGRRRVVDGVSLHVEPGEVVGLLGANGAGKTTTFYMIIGLERAERRAHHAGGPRHHEAADVPARAPRRRLPAAGAVGLPAHDGRREHPRRAGDDGPQARRAPQASGRAARRSSASSTCATRARDALSGGERRRTEIARALATEPQFILLDEPFAGIDPKAVDDIQQMILYLRRRGIGILITDHNVRETLGVTDRAYIMADGRIFRSGAPLELTEDAEVRRLYLGEKFRM